MSPTNRRTKTIIYTGAPISSSLSWSESHLTAPLQPAYYPTKTPSLLSASPPKTKEDQNVAPQYPKWRSLPLHRSHLPTGLTQATSPDFQPYHPKQNEEETSSFLSATDVSFVSDSVDGASFVPEGTTKGFVEADDEILTQYYEHSLAVHEEVP
ncbi:MAG: hypothetical protein L6R42_011255, partial [Xanthoria sp. 1 TBL-2021]